MFNFRLIRINLTTKSRFEAILINRCISSSNTSNCSVNTEFPPKNLPSPPVVKPIPKEYKQPVDWLPFQWHRRPMFNIYERSGDTIKGNFTDPSLPRPDFELSEELKNADEEIKKFFSLANARKVEMKEVSKRQLLKRIQRHPHDFESLEVRITLRTIQVRSLFEFKAIAHKTEKAVSCILLPILIQKRNKLLKQLRNIDQERFLWLCGELQLYFEPAPIGKMVHERYCKKWDLRRMTREYCAKLVDDKKAEYHAELKQQQADFLQEKEEALAWIQAEEDALSRMDV